jgi:RNA polymerase sigma-70 factor (sigma-E family)
MDAAAEAEFREFVTARWHALLRTAYLLTGDHGRAEDLLQTALMRTHRNWRRIERTDAPEVYVRRILVNVSNSWWRRRLSRPYELLTHAPPELAATDAHAAYDLRDELWRAVQVLPPRMRAVLVLRYFEDLPEAETARILGCSVGSVKSQTSRGLDRLRAALSQDPGGGQSGIQPPVRASVPNVPASRSMS